MRVLVVAASKYGATDEIADAIGRVLTDRGLMTVVKKPDEVDSMDAYGAVVLGSAVYAGHWMNPAKELVGRFPRRSRSDRYGYSPAVPSGIHRSRRKTRSTSPISRRSRVPGTTMYSRGGCPRTS